MYSNGLVEKLFDGFVLCVLIAVKSALYCFVTCDVSHAYGYVLEALRLPGERGWRFRWITDV